MPKAHHISHYWYFGYGSEINEHILIEMDLAVHQAMKAFLSDYRLVFTNPSPTRPGGGMPDLLYSTGSIVEGMLYEVDDQGISILDAYYRVGHMIYRRKSIEVVAEDGMTLPAAVYVGCRSQVGLLPLRSDWVAMVEGAKKRGMSSSYIQELTAFQCVE